MPVLDYYVSLEQETADEAVEKAVLAEQTGFQSIWAADHFHPWFATRSDGTGARSADCWTWLAAALERTEEVPVGTSGTAFLNRHHPVDVAHRLATLLELYPDRAFLGVGTGTALNELPLGYPWPEYGERAKRTAEGIGLLRQLFKESYVDHDGEYWTTEAANLFSGPDDPPPITVAAGGPTTARLSGDLGDGFLTVYRDPESIQEELFPALEAGVERSDRNSSIDDVEKTVLLNCSYAAEESTAIEACRPLAGSLLPVFFDSAVSDPRYIQEHGAKVGAEEIRAEFLICTDADALVDAVERYSECGFDRIALHDNSPDSEAFCELVEKSVLPSFG